MASLLHQSFSSPLGPLTAMVLDDAGREALCMLEFGNPERVSRERGELARHFACEPHAGRVGLHDEVERQLTAYFDGDLSEFTLPLETPGTEFQQRVWNALLDIPLGQTCSYGELATRIDSPGGQRAVGAANGANRIAIVVPCHRVIESTGKLRGYGGGLERKQWLLAHEGAWPTTPTLFDAATAASAP
jgi:AraC family transcriptional regulator of adaptative response/methylated-DNA-[protein]-cysteine methyltransferase